jgi:hypothetical protein
VELARLIRETSGVFWVMMMIERVRPGRAITKYEIAPILKMDLRTAETHMNNLCASNDAVFDGRGYALTAGRTLFLGMDQAQEIDMAHAEAHGRKALAIKQVHADPALTSAEGVQVSQSLQPIYPAHTVCVPLKKDKKEEEDLLLIKSSSSDSGLELKSTQSVGNLRPGNEIAYAIANGLTSVPEVWGFTDEDGISLFRMACADGTFITARDILVATETIKGFGDVPLHVLPVDAIKPEIALAWVAKGYEDMGKLANPPAGLVVARLRNSPPQNPPRRYLMYAVQILPDEYCEALRLPKYECKSCVDVSFSTRTAYDEHVQAKHTVQVVEEEQQHFEYVENEQLAPMWEKILENMQKEMPHVSFNTWLRDTVAVSDGEVLIVGARNQYCADWLNSRVSDRVSTLTGKQVSFVCGNY